MRKLRNLVFLFLFLISVTAFGDGKFFGRNSVKQPDMPRQRALVTYKDGVETLIVESVVDSEVGEMAWVVPVPNKPTEVGFATEGTVATLPELLIPEVIDKDPIMTMMLGLFTLFGVLYCIRTVGVKPVARRKFLTEYLLIIFVAFIPASIFFPVFASAGTPGMKGIEWKQTDGMEAAVVSDATTQEVVKWLNVNGFDVDIEAAKVIDAHITDGWSFVVSRVKSGGGEVAPKPLKVVFRTDKPVYPMRLTGTGVNEINVDLCVVSDSPMHAAGFDTFETVKWESIIPLTKHPEVTKYVWDGAFVSRLVGTLDGDQLSEDIYLKSGGGTGKKQFAADGAIAGITLNWILWGIIICQGVFGVVAINASWNREKFLKFGIGLPLALGALVGLGYTLIVPTVETESRYIHGLKSEAKQMQMAGKSWASDIENEDEYRTLTEKIGRGAIKRWGKDVPGGVVRQGDFVVTFDTKGDPMYFKITKGSEDKE